MIFSSAAGIRFLTLSFVTTSPSARVSRTACTLLTLVDDLTCSIVLPSRTTVTGDCRILGVDLPSNWHSHSDVGAAVKSAFGDLETTAIVRLWGDVREQPAPTPMEHRSILCAARSVSTKTKIVQPPLAREQQMVS